jgi:hypothetical protein
MFSASAKSLLQCFERGTPELLRAFLLAAGSRRTADAGRRGDRLRDPDRLRSLYHGIGASDFSRDVLERCPEAARVLVVPCCGWTDLGTPERIAECEGLYGPVVDRARARRKRAPEAPLRRLAAAGSPC